MPRKSSQRGILNTNRTTAIGIGHAISVYLMFSSSISLPVPGLPLPTVCRVQHLAKLYNLLSPIVPFIFLSCHQTFMSYVSMFMTEQNDESPSDGSSPSKIK